MDKIDATKYEYVTIGFNGVMSTEKIIETLGSILFPKGVENQESLIKTVKAFVSSIFINLDVDEVLSSETGVLDLVVLQLNKLFDGSETFNLDRLLNPEVMDVCEEYRSKLVNFLATEDVHTKMTLLSYFIDACFYASSQGDTVTCLANGGKVTGLEIKDRQHHLIASFNRVYNIKGVSKSDAKAFQMVDYVFLLNKFLSGVENDDVILINKDPFGIPPVLFNLGYARGQYLSYCLGNESEECQKDQEKVE